MQVYGHYSLLHGAGLTTIMSKQHFIYIFFIYCIYFSIYFILNTVHGPVIVEYLQFIINSVIKNCAVVMSHGMWLYAALFVHCFHFEFCFCNISHHVPPDIENSILEFLCDFATISCVLPKYVDS